MRGNWAIVNLAIGVAALCSTPALANDSTSELAAGGLILTKSEAIAMRSEDLSISPKEVVVRYRFLNTTGHDIATMVAFPMPDIDMSEPDTNLSIPADAPANVLAFHTTVEGRPVSAQVEQKVFAKGVDQTGRLRALGIPLAPYLAVTRTAFEALPPAQWDEMIALGLGGIDEYDIGHGMHKHLEPRWLLRTTFYWEQTFPAGRELAVEHRYTPAVGHSAGTMVGTTDPNSAPMTAKYRQKYCIDHAFLSAVARVQKAAKANAPPFTESRIEYVLKTGANWAGPIGDFHLVVDKGAANNLVTFCGEGWKKISPTRFEMRKHDFTPQADIAVLILEPYPANR